MAYEDTLTPLLCTYAILKDSSLNGNAEGKTAKSIVSVVCLDSFDETLKNWLR
jgi:hypothetical protein